MSARRRIFAALILGALVFTGCHAIPKAEDVAQPPTSATVGETTIVAIASPTRPAPPSIFDFLGVPQIAKGVCALVGSLQNQLGMLFPGMEPGPPLLAITDPANLDEDAPPAVQAAAKIKAEEDAAPQKIKAVRYLAQIGCGGCYPGVEDALLAAMDDCTEAVRYAAVLAVRDAVGKPCTFCSDTACCSPKVQTKLYELGFGTDAACCPAEPSDRVRRQARLAFGQCGAQVQYEEAPLEGGELPPEEGPPAGPDMQPPGAEELGPAPPAVDGEMTSWRSAFLSGGSPYVSVDAPGATSLSRLPSTERRMTVP